MTHSLKIWWPVSWACDVGFDGECSICGQEYGDCPCPGPTMDEYDYEIFNGELYAMPNEETQMPEAPKHFKFDHLPPFLGAVSQPFAHMASWLLDTLPDCDQRDVAVQKLLEAKDAAVRARLDSKD